MPKTLPIYFGLQPQRIDSRRNEDSSYQCKFILYFEFRDSWKQGLSGSMMIL